MGEKENQKDNIIKKNRAKVEKHSGATTAALVRKKKHTKDKQHLEEKNMGRKTQTQINNCVVFVCECLCVCLFHKCAS